jgi:hypothetical protein
MKKIVSAIIGSPRTSLMGVASGIISVLVYYHTITVEAGVLFLGLVGSLIGLLGQDGGSSTPSTDAPDKGGDRPKDPPINP